jgi:DNA ligase 1
VSAFDATMMHAHDWRGQDVRGWYITEKLDGCRARWTGRALLSRGGHPISAPERITQGLPPIPLDCEVYAGRAGRLHAGRAVQWGRWHDSARLIVFDAPTLPGDIAQRLAAVRERWGLATVPELGRATDLPALIEMLQSVQASGGEGLMLHRPFAAYRPGRAPDLLKVKDAYALRLAA